MSKDLTELYLPMREAIEVAKTSNDPDRRVGAVTILAGNNRVVSTAANRIWGDFSNREEKRHQAEHAEARAIQAAREAGINRGDILEMVITRFPCSQCLLQIAAYRIERVFYLEPIGKDRTGDSFWSSSMRSTINIAFERGIKLVEIPRSYFDAHTLIGL